MGDVTPVSSITPCRSEGNLSWLQEHQHPKTAEIKSVVKLSFLQWVATRFQTAPYTKYLDKNPGLVWIMTQPSSSLPATSPIIPQTRKQLERITYQTNWHVIWQSNSSSKPETGILPNQSKSNKRAVHLFDCHSHTHTFVNVVFCVFAQHHARPKGTSWHWWHMRLRLGMRCSPAPYVETVV